MFEKDRNFGKEFGSIVAPRAEAADFFALNRPFADGAGPVADEGMLRAGEGDAEGGGVAVFEEGDLLAGFVPEPGGGIVAAGKEAAFAAVGDAEDAAFVRGPFGNEAGGSGVVEQSLAIATGGGNGAGVAAPGELINGVGGPGEEARIFSGGGFAD